jgi:hypothetical protein
MPPPLLFCSPARKFLIGKSEPWMGSMAEVNLIDTHCRELAEEISEMLPEDEASVRRVLAYLIEVIEKRFAAAAAALPPALTALLSVVEVV